MIMEQNAFLLYLSLKILIFDKVVDVNLVCNIFTQGKHRKTCKS